MKVEELAGKVKAGAVDELTLVSVEGGSYTLHFVKAGESHRVLNAHGETLHVASVDEARKLLVNVPATVPLYLVQPAVHDEMVGLDSGPGDSREQIPLHSSQ